ncbi:MAG TPA: HPF/RaiA family ribosome-associated protein [Candidatus Cybelea sp.]|nr:HPF/RaiA family ribosome-associated protein [Candidatus Cybelea sp.]
MQLPLTVTFRNLDASPAVEADVRKHADKLERFFPRIMSCNVVVEAPNRRRHKGNLYRVRIDLKVPGQEIVVNETGPKNHAHEDIYVAVRDAFDAVVRRLEDHARRGQGAVKAHASPDTAQVVKLFPTEGYGFARTEAGGDVYFHRNSVVGPGFDSLEAGSQVRLTIAEGEGENGPQASTVTPIGKHHPTSRS